MLLANDFLAGTAFIDSNSNGKLDTTESYLAGATIELRESVANGNGLIATQVTDAQGGYFFGGLTPGDYQLVNLAASGYNASSSDALSKISPVTGTSTNSINVQLLDPADLTASIDINRYNQLGLFRNFSYNIFGTQVSASGGQLPAKLHSNALTPNPTDEFLTLCVDLFNDLGNGVNGPFVVTPDSNPIGSGTPHNAERVAYLYNHYGQSALPSASAAALQIAVWELLYDADAGDPDGNLSAGNFRVTSNPGSAVLNQAAFYLTDSLNKSESAVFLNVPPPSPAVPTLTRTQGIIVTGSFNFGNIPGAGDVSLGDFVWEDLNADGIQDPGEPGIGGVTVYLKDASGTIIDDTTTGLNGAYLFDDLPPGTYSVQFVQPFGYSGISPANEGVNDNIDSDGVPDADPLMNLMTATTTLTAGQSDLSLDQGFYRLAALGDFVWEDTNGNGQQDVGEPGVNGVTVLLKKDGVLTGDSTVTANIDLDGDGTPDGDGGYKFAGLTPGDYSVQFVLPGGQVFTTVNAAGVPDDLDSDADPAMSGMTQTVTLESGDYDRTLDAGLITPAALGDFVWEDTNGNGQQDVGEPGVNGVTVLLKKDGVLTGDSTVTANIDLDGDGTPDGDGGYKFAGLTPGDYSVQFVLPGGQVFTTVNAAGVPDDLDSDADPAMSGMTQTVTLESGDYDRTLDAGLITPAALGDFVWEDTNGNGQQDVGEPGVNGVTVLLKKDGVLTGDSTVTANIDLDGDGTPDGDGGYKFAGLTPGDYSVQFVLPGGQVFTTVNAAGVPDDLDSDADPAMSGMTQTVTLESGDYDRTLDAGLITPAALGDFVWEDTNGNGQQDVGEPGVNGVTVLLKKDGVLTGDSTVTANIDLDGDGTPDGDGGYKFAGLTPGDYSVQFVLPGGQVFTTVNAAGVPDDLDSDADPAMSGMTQTVTLESGDYDRTLDAGLITPAALGDFVWEDTNGNGQQDVGEPGVNGVTVLLKKDGVLTGDSTVTANIDLDGDGTPDGDGGYKFAGLTPGDYSVQFVLPGGQVFTTVNAAGVPDDLDSDADPAMSGMTQTVTLESGDYDRTLDAGLITPAALGDFVWEDTNGNGQQDVGEPGVNGVTVLLKKDGVLTGDSTVTANIDLDGDGTPDGDGGYKFAGLTPGDYSVQFVLPGGQVFTTVNAAGVPDDLDSDADPAMSGMTQTVTLESGDYDRTLDAGLITPAALGDFVWEDTNGNGQQDVGEPGVNGVTVLLKKDGVLTGDSTVTANIDLDGDGTPDGDGGYKFAGLTPGDYSVQFVLPGGQVFTTVNAAGVPDDLDSDADPAMSGMTQTVTLESGDYDRTLDAGLVAPAAPEIDIEKFTRIDVNPIDIEKLVRVESPAIQGDVCEVLNKPVSLTFQYIPSTDFNPLQPSGKAGVLANNGLDDDGTSYVVVSKNDDPNDFGDIFFQGDVSEDELFTASGSFGSNTYFFFFDEMGGPLLQSFHYHTSCSAPIILGAQPLSATLVGYNDGTPGGDIQAPDYGPGVNDADADTPSGPSAAAGDTVVFTYVVTNPVPGTELSNIQVEDLVLAPPGGVEFEPDPVSEGGFNVGDTDRDNNLDSGEVWLYVSTTSVTSTTPTGLHIDKATVVGTNSGGGEVMDMDPAHFTVTAGITQGDQCDINGKVVSLTFEYIPGTTVVTGQDSSKATATGMIDDDGESYIVVGDGDLFEGTVVEGATFTVSGNFGSNTVFEIYDSFAAFQANASPLQTLEYHTSCSQPIQLGDVVGSVILVGYDGEDGSATLPPTMDPPVIDFGGILFTTDAPFDPNNIGLNADSPTGPVAQLGEKATWTYVVSNPGNVPLSIISVFDDNETNDQIPGLGSDDFEPAPVEKAGGFNIGDDNNDGLLDPNETWYYQAMEIVTEPGQHKNTAKVRAEDSAGTMVMDSDMSNHIVNPLVFEKYVYVPTPPSSEDQCDVNGKVVTLSFEYSPGTVVLSGQDSSKATATGTPDNDGESYIVVGGGDLFEGIVAAGAVFDVGGSFGSNTVFEIYDDFAAFQAGDDPLQVLEYHTSCSQPIQLGDTVGSVVLVGYEGEDGSATQATGLGDPADSPTGPSVIAGDEVVFYYEVANVGNVGLTNVEVTDDQGLLPILDEGDVNNNNILDPGEVWIYSAAIIASSPGQQMNVGTVTANSVDDLTGEAELTASDLAHHFVETLKFFVVDKSDDANYSYTDGGRPISDSPLADGNSDPRGISADQNGDLKWVIDKDKHVYVYNSDGSLARSWKANGIGGEAEGIAVHPDPNDTGLWIVDKKEKAVFYYATGKTHSGGDLDPTSSFSLNLDDDIDSKNDHPKGLTTDGVSLWVVDDDGGTEKVFKYSIATGALVGSWEIADEALEEPRGITVDPNGGSTIWIVDKKSDTVYQFDDATGVVSGSESSDAMFALAGENADPEGIADPILAVTEKIDGTSRYDVSGDGEVSAIDALRIINAMSMVDSEGEVIRNVGNAAMDLNRDGKISAIDALMIINYLGSAEYAQSAQVKQGNSVPDVSPISESTQGDQHRVAEINNPYLNVALEDASNQLADSLRFSNQSNLGSDRDTQSKDDLFGEFGREEEDLEVPLSYYGLF
ncbi:Serine-aspartate repeat-containing protein D precursor [Stieleria neptunia]|uniref:Serine-aspartate repeat-containing protein D n=2 Tax=Stieleria neptunia TaxID=2527979 RepID=A0A518HTS6_9BACT|nr:Serine-aspartate repeat-containing protein D precursor [Stieleria neptunia]